MIDPNEKNNSNWQQPQNNTYSWNNPYQPPMPKQWPVPQLQPQQNSPLPTPPPVIKKPEDKKKKKRIAKAIGAVAACLVISAGSIGGFAALVNAGYVKIGTTSSSQASTTDPAYVVTKNVSNASTSSSTATGQLTLQEIAKKVVPSVVCIQNYQSSGGNGVEASGEGSGIIMSSDGYIITNAHVVSGASSLKVVTSDGKTYEAKLIGSDTITDLALVKIDATGLTAAEFGDTNSLQVADTVVAIGNPGGIEFNSSVTVGYVSALNRAIETQPGYTMKCIQTDAAINPGNSGGALVNMYGQVVGINSSKIVAEGFEGLGFAISINEAQPVISNLKQYGYVKDRAVIGISFQMIDSMTSRFYRLPVGLYVSDVTSQNVSSASIKKGDVITQINGKDITAESDVTSVVASKKPGDTVTLTVYNTKTGQSQQVTITLSEATQ